MFGQTNIGARLMANPNKDVADSCYLIVINRANQ